MDEDRRGPAEGSGVGGPGTAPHPPAPDEPPMGAAAEDAAAGIGTRGITTTESAMGSGELAGDPDEPPHASLDYDQTGTEPLITKPVTEEGLGATGETNAEIGAKGGGSPAAQGAAEKRAEEGR